MLSGPGPAKTSEKPTPVAEAPLCTLTALALDLRAFADRFFAARFVRWVRDFTAMILPAPDVDSIAWRGYRCHGELRPASKETQEKPNCLRISLAWAPEARNSRKPVEPVDLESLCPALSRISW